jgi:hypothetical protein
VAKDFGMSSKVDCPFDNQKSSSDVFSRGLCSTFFAPMRQMQLHIVITGFGPIEKATSLFPTLREYLRVLLLKSQFTLINHL